MQSILYEESGYMGFSGKHRQNSDCMNTFDNNFYKYDVAVSYDSCCKRLVEKVVAYLKCERFEVFFDMDRKSELLSENLETKLYQVYQNESLVKVLFVTAEYLENEYTLLEARRSFTSVKDNNRRLVIINFMGRELPKPYSDFAYLNGSAPADEIAYMIGERIKELRVNCNNEEKVAERKAGEKIYIENINLIDKNNGIVAGNNANFQNVSIYKADAKTN